MGPVELSFDITDALPADVTDGRRIAISAWAFVPDDLAWLGDRPVTMTLLAGGSYDKRYHHAVIPGYPGYSAAQHLAGRGNIVLLAETPREMTMDDLRGKGLALFGEIYGEEAANSLAAYIETDAFGVECAKWSNDYNFGTIWVREGLERKLRSCVVLGMMIALRQSSEISYHTQMGIANGLTRKEIEEVLYTAVPYCGLPASNTARAAMMEAFSILDGNRTENP